MRYLLHHLLEESAKKYPRKNAVVYNNDNISYSCLNILSDQICFCLMKQGVKVGDRVGIYIDKNIHSVAAIFGVLKAGACYVPLDPLAPASRNALIINDCALRYLVSSENRVTQLTQIITGGSQLACVVLIDVQRSKWRADIRSVKIIFNDDVESAPIVTRAEHKDKMRDGDLAYILYTSGSTGTPKGVMISHRASLAFIEWAAGCFGVDQEDAVSSCAPFHFDISIFDIFVTISAGATMHIIPAGIAGFPCSLADFIENKKISIWYSVPSVLVQLVLYGALEKRDLSSLRRVLFAGDIFPVTYLKKLMRTTSNAQYYNLYGPTETNVCSYYHVQHIPADDKPIPIGTPCEGATLYIINEKGRCARVGERGELYVSGPTLMEGYWNDPRRTKSVLLENFAQANHKVYKTGDFVVAGPGGNLEYHGRCDAMIKSRGYRIELGEIEHVLCLHPDIHEAVAVGVPDEVIGKRIKAVVVLKGGSSVTANTLRMFCSKTLPAYMVPDLIVIKDYLPKTGSGKIDREFLTSEEG